MSYTGTCEMRAEFLVPYGELPPSWHRPVINSLMAHNESAIINLTVEEQDYDLDRYSSFASLEDENVFIVEKDEIGNYLDSRIICFHKKFRIEICLRNKTNQGNKYIHCFWEATFVWRFNNSGFNPINKDFEIKLKYDYSGRSRIRIISDLYFIDRTDIQYNPNVWWIVLMRDVELENRERIE